MIRNMWNRLLLLSLCMGMVMPVMAETKKTEMANLVCFVRFAGEDEGNEFGFSFSDYDRLFNDETVGANSVYNYFKEASYGQLDWKTSFFPVSTDDRVVSYQAEQERGYYKEKSSINESGYSNDVDRAARELALLKEIAEYLSQSLPENTLLDADNDGIIDNLCVVFSGRSELSARHLLWPHRTDLALPDEKAIFVQGKKLTGYLMVFDDANGWASLSPIPLNTGVLCHEMSHSLNTYDLYHVNDDLNPVGVWDLMSDNLRVPQHMSVYTKYRYCGWIDEIPEISEPGTYVLNPVGGVTSENIAYKIKPVGSDEYFVVEYRRKAGTFDSGLPESGLLVYRINPAYTGGNVNYNGTTRLDEVYIFRPGGTTKVDGNIEQAAFSAENGRTAFGGSADLKPFYSDGTEARFALTNISSCGETLSFDLVKLGHQLVLSESAVTFRGEVGEKMELTVEADVDWIVAGVPEWLALNPAEGKAGKTVVVMETLVDNPQPQGREGQITFTSPSDETLSVTLTVKQQSNLILPPSDLTAVTENGGVKLEWTAPEEGAPTLVDGFEDTSNPNGWTIENAGDRGWTWHASDKYNPAYTGNYSMYMKSAMEDLHQDERLTSPVFANGQTLTFLSRSIAPGKTVKNQFYYVEVSTDGGETWEVVYDLMKDCQTVNQFEKITIDLSAYQSDRMRVSFHAYDTNNVGLSYWWQVDDVSISSGQQGALVQGYAVYRNGELIGTTEECAFVDSNPVNGENVYTVRATGTFGETSDSEPATVVYAPSGVECVDVKSEVDVQIWEDRITITSDVSLKYVRLMAMNSTVVKSVRMPGTACTLDVSDVPSGFYLLVYEPQGATRPLIRKVICK